MDSDVSNESFMKGYDFQKKVLLIFFKIKESSIKVYTIYDDDDDMYEHLFF